MEGLQMDLVVNEQHIKKQNENIESVKEEIQEVLKRLQLDTLEEKNRELVEKITYLEETISEINEKKLLTEDNPTLPGDPSTNNSADPLTPLNQKFATLDDLQNHYRTFINRIQQQIATIGGGGAGVIHDLDDVTFDRTTGDGKLLIYNGSKWVGIASTAVGGGAASELATDATGTNLTLSGNLNVSGDLVYDEATARNWNISGIATATKLHVGVDTGFYSEDLVVNGDARVTGILTVGNASITLNPDSKQITGINEILVGSGASLSLAPLTLNQGEFNIDYSELTLSGHNSALNGTYNRQTDSFVLSTAPSASGSARFESAGGYYYFLHESDNSKIIIYNLVDGFWSAIHSSGSNFSSPSANQLVNPITVSNFITSIREGYTNDGRAYPGANSGIAYKTEVVNLTSSIGIATATSLEVTGIATVSTAFYMPQYTTTARDAGTFNEGAMIYNTTIKKMEFYDGTNWVALPGMTLGLTVALDG